MSILEQIRKDFKKQIEILLEDSLKESQSWNRHIGVHCPIDEMETIVQVKYHTSTLDNTFSESKAEDISWNKVIWWRRKPPHFMLKSDNITYKNIWIEYDGKGQPLSDDVYVSYVYNNQSHIRYKAYASEVNWKTTDNGGIAFYKIIKVDNKRPDSNGWIKYDGKGMPVREFMFVDIKYLLPKNFNDAYGYEFKRTSQLINWPSVTHYRISKS